MVVWRPSKAALKFAREVGVIILGVLIALGIGEVADRVRWRSNVAEANAALLQDFARNAGVTHERSLLGPCIDRRLVEIATLLQAAQLTHRLPAIGDIGRLSSRPLPRAAWDTALATGVLSHMDRDESTRWSGWFDLVSFFGLSNDSERRLWGRLTVVTGQARPVSDTLLSELMLIVADLRGSSGLTTESGRQIERRSRELGAPPDYWIILDRAGGTDAAMAAAVAKRPMCRPLIVDGKPYRLSKLA